MYMHRALLIYTIKLSLLKSDCSIRYNFELLIELFFQVKITTELKREGRTMKNKFTQYVSCSKGG